MKIQELIAVAKERQASDVHMETGLPVCLRIDGKLVHLEEKIPPEAVTEICRKLVGNSNWSAFLSQGSWDFSRVIEKSRCRINVFRTARGLGVALRLLMSRPVTIANLNLHPDLMLSVRKSHGLVLFSGPTGSGKSTSMAALIEEINLSRAKHIITLEQPVEYFFSPKKSLIRQREVGRDTPTFSQGLRDALREDPDVIVVGEMRDMETIELTINAAETGHLVFATLHSATVAEAIARMAGSFGGNEQDAIKHRLADCLLTVICQRITFRREIGIRVPECEILFPNDSARSVIRNGHFTKLKDIILTGASENMWTLERYRRWLDEKTDWAMSDPREYSEEEDFSGPEPGSAIFPQTAIQAPRGPDRIPDLKKTESSRLPRDYDYSDSRLIIDDSDEDLSSILSDLDRS